MKANTGRQGDSQWLDLNASSIEAQTTVNILL